MELDNFSSYNVWANNKIRNILEDISEEEFVKELGSEFSHSSLRKTVLHTIVALEFCMSVINNEDSDSLHARLEELHKLPKKEILKDWLEIDNEYSIELQSNPMGLITLPNFHGQKLTIPKLDFLLQYTTHSIYHRGQIIIELKKLGKPVIGTDYLFFLEEIYSKKE